MSKLSFRARALDASKPMPIYLSEELPDLPEYLSINRSVPQMPSGMEKEEESERHLQEAISTGKVIPTPEIFSLVDMNHSDRFDLLYPAKFKPPKQYIHYQSYSFDSDVAEYDMDSEDEAWLNAQSAKMGCIITADQFEEMMDRLEKGSGQQVVTLKEAKLLVPEDDELVVAVYDYWLNKRLQLQYPLIPVVKTEKAVGNTQSANPYVAFRRRLEKMQTRKNRKNDEVSYEKMLKLRRDLSRAVTILEMIKRREKMKTEHLRLTVDIFERRHAVGDYSGQLVSDMSWHKWQRVISTSGSTLSRCSSAAPARPSFTYPSSNASVSSPHCRPQWPLHSPRINSDHKSKRSYKKRKHGRTHSSLSRSPASYLGGVCSAGDVVIDMLSSDEEDRCGSRAGRCRLPSVPAAPAPTLTTSQSTDCYQQEHEPDGEFTFRRKRGCHYHEPVSWWQNGEFAVAPVSLPSIPRRFQLGNIRQSLGLVRRRLGRGGRVIVDRACGGSMDDLRELGVDVQLEGCLSLDDMRQYAPSDTVSLLSDGATIANTDCLLSSPAAATSCCQLSSGCSQFQLRPSHSALVAPSSSPDVTHLLTALSRNMSPASCSAPLLSMTQSFNGSATPPSPPSVNRQTLSVAQCGVAVRPSCQHKSGPPLPADTPDQLHLSLPSPIAHTENHISEVTDVCKDKHITVSTQPLIKVKQLPLDAS